MDAPLFQNVDCLGVEVPDLDEALVFYRDRLGHELVWRTETSAGLRFPGTNSVPELVLHTEHWPITTAIQVESVEKACAGFVSAGGRVVEASRDIPIGKLAVVADPWNNRLVILDSSKGLYRTDAEGRVTGVERERDR